MVSLKQGGREGSWSMGLRLLITLLCITSLILLLKSKQTVQRSVGLGSVAQQVKYSDTSGFIYLVFCNVLVAAYAFIAFLGLIPSSLGRSYTGKAGRWAIFAFDQAFAYVLVSAVSAASEVLYLANTGMPKTQWEELCPTYGYFCHMLTASIVIGFVAVLLLALLSVASAHTLFHHFYTRAFFTTKMRHHSSLT